MMKKLLIITVVVFLLAASFAVGRATTPPEIQHDSPPMCLYRDTALRESPTGYIIFRLARGTELWVTRIEAPFAYVSYFDGKQWIDGSVTASYLGRCGAENSAEG